MTRQRAPIRAAVLALTLAGAFHTLPAQAVGLS
ncbi:hypothetical protein B0G69_2028 [Paraburkholderia sp. RAU2J]|nr:hypothetical protein B0G69_2028 [Paraburkholderia sp. RAU2J]